MVLALAGADNIATLVETADPNTILADQTQVESINRYWVLVSLMNALNSARTVLEIKPVGTRKHESPSGPCHAGTAYLLEETG